MGSEPTDTQLWLFPELGLCSFPQLLTSAVWNCWRTKILFLHLLVWLFATCIFGLIWVTVYFNTLRPLAYFCPLLFCSLLFCSSLSLLWGDICKTQFQIRLPMRTFLQTRSYCAVMSRLSSTAERGCSFQLLHQQLKAVYRSSLRTVTSDRFTACHRPLRYSAASTYLMVNKTNVHFWISRDLQTFSLIFAPPEMHPGPSKPSHLTRLLHVSYDPVKGHFRPHVACVVDRLPAGLQWKAHFCQLHYCRLVYFWSCEWDKHSINNCTVAAADSTQSGSLSVKTKQDLLLEVPLTEDDLSWTGWCGKFARALQLQHLLRYPGCSLMLHKMYFQ